MIGKRYYERDLGRVSAFGVSGLAAE
jgi:hypothetical protein